MVIHINIAVNLDNQPLHKTPKSVLLINFQKMQSNHLVVAAAASLISAQFANRVKNRTVGLVTGVVLTILGAAMLILNYWSIISQIPERFKVGVVG